MSRFRILLSLAVSSALTVCAQSAFAQDASKSAVGAHVPVQKLLTTPAGVTRTPEQMKAAEAILAAQGGPPRASQRPLPTMGAAAYQAAKAAAAAQAPGAKPAHPSAPPPGVPSFTILNKNGPSETDSGNGFYPPDTTGAIGPGYIVFPVNQTWNVYNRSFGQSLQSVSFNAFFGTGDALSDPRVIYDPLWKRWIVTDIVVPVNTTDPGGCFWLGVSNGPNPTAAFTVYRLCAFAPGHLWDYDILGMNQDGIILTGNHFDASENFVSAEAVAFPKAIVYNAQGFSVPLFSFPSNVGTLVPPIVQDSNNSAFLLAADSSGTVLNLYRGNNMSNEFQASVVLQAQIPASYSVPPNAKQINTSLLLDTLDGRFEHAIPQYGNTLWAVHTIALSSFPAPKFYQIDTSANSIVQSGFFFQTATSYDFNASIAANSGDEVFVTWNATDPTGSPKHQASVLVAGRQSGDTAGTMGASRTIVGSFAPLTGNIQNGTERWGDYSMVSLDPVSTATCGANRRAAIFNERIIDTNTWGTQFATIGFCK